jgi:hypothetical protein
MGNWYINVEQPAESRAAHVRALALFRAAHDTAGTAETLDFLGMTSTLGGDLAYARECLTKAGQLFEQMGNQRGLAASLSTLAVASGFYHVSTMASPAVSGAEGVDLAGRALKIARDIGWRAGEAYFLEVLAGCLGPTGRFGEAIAAATDSLRIAEQIGHRQWWVAAHFILGCITLDMLDGVAARSWLEQGLDAAREIGSRHWQRMIAGELALAHLALGDSKAAEFALAAELAPGTAMDTAGRRLCWLARAELALASGDAAAALDITGRLQASAAGPESSTAPQSVPRVALVRAKAQIAAGRPAEAATTLVEARRVSKENGDLSTCWRLESVLAEAQTHLGEHDLARSVAAAAADLAAHIAESIPAGAQRDEFLRLAHVS